jgi:cinnamyl-alcohol dehydrogenase
MSSINFTAPSAEEVKKFPREFALLTQIPGYERGTLSSDELKKAIEKYGDGDASALQGDVSFLEVAKALKKASKNKAGDKNTAAWVTKDKTSQLEAWSVDRRPISDEDIRIQITYAGICHSDLHQAKGEWGDAIFPMVPGHEIIGVVTEVGKNVKNFKLGDRAGVGCFVDSCRECQQCHGHEEQFCENGMVATYNGRNPRHENRVTYGGYSTNIVVADKYAIKIPNNLDMASSAPLLCAGITTYSPLRRFGLDKKGTKVGVIGLGGLGHMAVKLAKAMGADVTVISTSERKKKMALEMGADHFVVSKDDKQMLEIAGKLDGIIDTVSAEHDIGAALGCLKIDGKLIFVGVPPNPLQFQTMSLISGRKSMAGSMIGGIKETQEMIDFCGQNNITCETEVIDVDYLNTAFERLANNDVHYRFSIDIQGSLID